MSTADIPSRVDLWCLHLPWLSYWEKRHPLSFREFPSPTLSPCGSVTSLCPSPFQFPQPTIFFFFFFFAKANGKASLSAEVVSGQDVINQAGARSDLTWRQPAWKWSHYTEKQRQDGRKRWIRLPPSPFFLVRFVFSRVVVTCHPSLNKSIFYFLNEEVPAMPASLDITPTHTFFFSFNKWLGHLSM